MNIQQIYDQYRIPPNLQKHMLRVAALSQIITENWTGEIDREAILLTCVFHDMANIIKFNFKKPQLFKEEQSRIDYWKTIQTEFIQKYGNNIHLATLTICQEIGLPEKVLEMVKKLDWNNALDLLEQKDLEPVIPIYCDMRMGPYGIVSLKDRLNNWATRNNVHDFDVIKKSAELLEKTLQEHIPINLNEITDTQLNNRFTKLLELTK